MNALFQNPMPSAAPHPITNVRLAGLGGMGVLRAAGLLAQTAFASGFVLKTTEVHGMAQRGGSLSSDIRFAPADAVIFSPMIPEGEIDWLVLLADSERPVHERWLRPGGRMIGPGDLREATLPHPKSLNVALLGALSYHLPFPEERWIEAIRQAFPEKLEKTNLQAFSLGRQSQPQNSNTIQS